MPSARRSRRTKSPASYDIRRNGKRVSLSMEMSVKIGLLIVAAIATYYKGQMDAQAKVNELEKSMRYEIQQAKDSLELEAKSVAEEVSKAKLDAEIPNVQWRLGQLEEGQGRLLVMVEEVRSGFLDWRAKQQGR